MIEPKSFGTRKDELIEELYDQNHSDIFLRQKLIEKYPKTLVDNTLRGREKDGFKKISHGIWKRDKNKIKEDFATFIQTRIKSFNVKNTNGFNYDNDEEEKIELIKMKLPLTWGVPAYIGIKTHLDSKYKFTKKEIRKKFGIKSMRKVEEIIYQNNYEIVPKEEMRGEQGHDQRISYYRQSQSHVNQAQNIIHSHRGELTNSLWMLK